MTYQEICAALRGEQMKKEASVKKLANYIKMVKRAGTPQPIRASTEYSFRDPKTGVLPQGRFYGQTGYKPVNGSAISTFDHPGNAPLHEEFTRGTKGYNAAIKGLTPQQIQQYNTYIQDFQNRYKQSQQKFQKDYPNVRNPWQVR